MKNFQSELQKLMITNFIVNFQNDDKFNDTIKLIKEALKVIGKRKVDLMSVKRAVDEINKNTDKSNIDLKKYNSCIRYFKRTFKSTDDITNFLDMEKEKFLEFNYIKDVTVINLDKLTDIFEKSLEEVKSELKSELK